MRIAHYVLIGAVMLAVIGFISAVLFDQRQLGKGIFLVGFFVGAASGVFVMLTSARGDFGEVGKELKIAAGGFGVIVLGQLVNVLLGKDEVIGNVFFSVGLIIMVIGIVLAVFRRVRP